MPHPPTHTDTALEVGCLELHLMPVTTDCEVDRPLLSIDEQARAARFRRTVDRVLFVQAHGLLRRVLSHHADVAPAHWQFLSGQWGKPSLCPHRHPNLQALRFNLSHCAGHVALAVAWGREVGVDIERRDALAEPGELALSVLGPSERLAWQQLGADLSAQQQFLMTRWTLKEAALKALGFGLGQIAPDQLEFHRTADGEDWLAVPSPTQPVAALHDWSRHGWLRSGQVASTHHWAIACERRPGETVSLQRVHHPAPGTAG